MHALFSTCCYFTEHSHEASSPSALTGCCCQMQRSADHTWQSVRWRSLRRRGAQGVTVLTGAVTASCRKFSAKYARIYSREADSAQDFPRLLTELCHLLAAAAPDNLRRGARAYFCSAPSCNACRCSWTTRSLNAPWLLKVACYNNVLGWYWHKWLRLATDAFIWCSAGRCFTVLAASNI